MASFVEAKITEVLEERTDLVRVMAETSDQTLEAVGFPSMLGPVATGDRVVLNTTGIELGLGTGGVAFMLWNLDAGGPTAVGEGHIVKLRYTPWQMNVLAAEAPESPHHAKLTGVRSIDGMPVVTVGLHSQVAPAVAGIKAEAPEASVGYLMTDAASLPMAWSRSIARLKEQRLLDATCTTGQAFGGDLEAVNVFSGLAALRHAAEVDVVVAGMGPGVVGTGTELGFSAIEQGQLIDAISGLEGRPIAALRISFADERERHRGVSHHTLTAMTIAAHTRATVVAPKLSPARTKEVEDQLRSSGVCDKHDLVWRDGRPGLELLSEHGIELRSMGRGVDETPELFLAGVAAGRAAAELL
jgi:Protein of unknown function (DUF3866)